MLPSVGPRRRPRAARVARVLRTLPEGAALALVVALPPHRPASARARETVDIGVEDAAAPWSQADGTGYANDIVRAAFAAAGADVRLHVLPYARCKQYVLMGELVACVSMSPAPELRGAVRFSAQPLFVFTCDLFENPARPLPRRLEEFPAGTRVGTVIGYEYPPEMLERLRQRGAVLEPTPTEELNLRKLAAGRIDAATVNRDAVKAPAWVVARAGVTGRVRAVLQIGATPAYIGFSLAHPDGRALADRFDAGYARLIASGARDRIQHEWIARTLASP